MFGGIDEKISCYLWLVMMIFIVSCHLENESQVETNPQITAYPTYSEPSPPTAMPILDIETAIDIFLAEYGWSISHKIATHTERLPDSFEHKAGDFPYAIYWAYNNELSREIGLDLTPYLGMTVQASLYQLNERLPEVFRPNTTARAVVIVMENEVIGAWIDQGRYYGFACSLNKKRFEEIVDQKWGEWLVSSGVVNLANDLDNRLAKMTPEEVIEQYYISLNEHDYQLLNAVRSRRALAGDLFTNMFDEEALYNHQEDVWMITWIDNIESAEFISVVRVAAGQSHITPIAP